MQRNQFISKSDAGIQETHLQWSKAAKGVFPME